MMRGLIEKILCSQRLDELFKQSAKAQYTREQLFSTVVKFSQPGRLWDSPIHAGSTSSQS